MTRSYLIDVKLLVNNRFQANQIDRQFGHIICLKNRVTVKNNNSTIINFKLKII